VPERISKCSKVGALSRSGFTLIEIVVALCIVAILTAIAIPGFKKATEDFRLNSTLEDTLDILKACRTYYLIFNEFPLDAGLNAVPNRLDLFIPTHLMNSSKKLLICRPLGKTAYTYDVDNWLTTSNKPHSVGVSLASLNPNAVGEKIRPKFQPNIGRQYMIYINNERILCLLPECPGSNIDFNSNTTWENRYY
jgi:prepilin-type N-terminal cleavage/methylation domain-containing protein